MPNNLFAVPSSFMSFILASGEWFLSVYTIYSLLHSVVGGETVRLMLKLCELSSLILGEEMLC